MNVDIEQKNNNFVSATCKAAFSIHDHDTIKGKPIDGV